MRNQPARSFNDLYLLALGAALCGYAIGGRGFAYIGVPPFYVAEVLLGLGVLAMLQTGCILAALVNIPSLMLVVLIGFTILRTLPYVPAFGIDALRDSVLVLYAVFAFVVATLMLQRPERVAQVTQFLRWFTGFYAFACPFVMLLMIFELLPAALTWPGAPAPLVSLRGGEAAVHLAGCALFAVFGLRRVTPLWLLSLVLGIVMVASFNRGGMLAMLLPIVFALPLTRARYKASAILATGVVILGLAYAADVGLPKRPDQQRAIGARQVVDNLLSLVLPAENRQMDDTKAWRLMWWKYIRNYTLEGQYFWTGKGFGVNLAVADGFVVGTESGGPPLRSPHNSHMNVLARTGVPGFTLWIAVAVSWLATILLTAWRAWRQGDESWANLMLFVACYWLANVVNASFDVALEGPMLGVWFWSQTGFGLGVVMVYRAAHGEVARRRAALRRHALAGA